MTIEFSMREIETVAKKLLRLTKDGDIIALSGPLAAGKTTLVSALLAAYGYSGHVASPTFVIERRYRLSKGKIKEVLHLDFYRLSPEQLDSLDWLDNIGEAGTLALIEWPERVADQLPSKTKTIKLEIINDQTRRLTFSENSTH
jgi:tRNA threonylcarbamoyladenosine biosynthesis protein TsaE